MIIHLTIGDTLYGFHWFDGGPDAYMNHAQKHGMNLLEGLNRSVTGPELLEWCRAEGIRYEIGTGFCAGVVAVLPENEVERVAVRMRFR